MGEKRFKFSSIDGIIDNVTGDDFPYSKDGFDAICELLNELSGENQQLKKELDSCKKKHYKGIIMANKNFLKIIDDYFIVYDGETYNLHKTSDIRALMHNLNIEKGFDPLYCEYNGEIPK